MSRLKRKHRAADTTGDARRRELERENERLLRDNEQLRRELSDSEKRLADQNKRIADLGKQNADLERKLGLKLQNSTTSSKPPSSDRTRTVHAPDLLRNAETALVRKAAPECERLFRFLDAVLEE